MTDTYQINKFLSKIQLDQDTPTWSSHVLAEAVKNLPASGVDDVHDWLSTAFDVLKKNQLTFDRASLIKDLVIVLFTSNRRTYLRSNFDWLNRSLVEEDVSKPQAYFSAFAAPPGSLCPAAILRILRTVDDTEFRKQIRCQLSDETEREEVIQYIREQKSE